MLARGILTACAVALAWSGAARLASAETFLEHSAETRMQLDLVVSDAALRKMLPAGWDPVVATQGAAKDCNVRMIFIDRVDITATDGSPIGSNQLVYLAVPIKKTGTDLAGQMIIAGITANPKDVPGPFEVYTSATEHRLTRTTTVAGGAPTEVDETWQFTGSDGGTMSLHVKYERGVARKGSSEVKFFSAADPNKYQIFKIEQGIDIMRNATVPVKDRVKEISYKASGGTFGGLFDGTEKIVSVDAFHWYNRTVFTP